MEKDDIQISVNVTDGAFSLKTTGDMTNTVQTVILALAVIWEKIRRNDISDAELEDYILEEYREAVAFVRENLEESSQRVNVQHEN